MDKFFDFVKRGILKLYSFTKRHMIFVGALVVAILCLYFYISVMRYGRGISKTFSKKTNLISLKDTSFDKTKTFYVYDSINNYGIIVNPVKIKNIYSFNRIIFQLKTIQNRASAHNKVIDYFIVNQYYVVIIQCLFMVFVCILGLIISKKGWGDSSDNLLGTFLVCCGFLLFFQILPKGMKIEDNISANKGYYLQYISMQNTIYTYLTNDEIDAKFTTTIDDLLKTYNTISFDMQQVPFSEVQKQFKEIQGASKDQKDGSVQMGGSTVITQPVQTKIVYKEVKTDTTKPN